MSLVIPQASRTSVKNYGVSNTPDDLSEWDEIREQIETSSNYWICSTRIDGSTQATPVWGGVVDDIFYFCSTKSAVKTRNIVQTADIVVHLESGNDTLIIEGHAEPMIDYSIAERLATIFAAKYFYKPTAAELLKLEIYAVHPKLVLAWKESDFRKTPTRWVFQEVKPKKRTA